ncbi:hypothetical protein NFI96_016621, partial [Prochilodus magdalenae]
IKDVHLHMFNCCIAELYLQNNEIASVSAFLQTPHLSVSFLSHTYAHTGALRHLTCLRVLLMHNNQLKNLEETVAELRNTQCLQTVNFFLNPFTQDPEYRPYVIHYLPSVQILDRKEVMQEERTHAFRLFSPERQRILDMLAFGRRALTPPVGRKISQTLKLRGIVLEDSRTCYQENTYQANGVSA